MIPNPQLLAKLSEGCIVKLASVLLGDLCQWLYFHPFGKIINPYHQEFHLPCPHRKRTKDIKSPLGKGPKAIIGVRYSDGCVGTLL